MITDIRYSREQLLAQLHWLIEGVMKNLPSEHYEQIVLSPEKIQAFNGQMLVEIRNPFPDIEGAVKGKALYKFLGSCCEEDVTVSSDEGALYITSGSSHLTLECTPTRPLATFEDQVEGNHSYVFDAQWHAGLKRALTTVGGPEYSGFLTGVFLWERHAGLCLSSSDNHRYSETLLYPPALLEDVKETYNIALPTPVAKHLHTMGTHYPQGVIQIGPRMVCATFFDEDMQWAGRIWGTARPVERKHTTVIDRVLDAVETVNEHEKEPVPDTFIPSLQRALAVLDSPSIPIKAVFKGHSLHLHGRGRAGTSFEVVEFTNKLSTTEQSMSVQIPPVLSVATGAQDCHLNVKAWVFCGQDWMRLTSVSPADIDE